ncbi:RNA-guided pseudouridylation complex pseudouridine synthase subunit Cbf5 [Methanosarcinales archaeon]|nr:MAG: RNA-guided pseudouridylation complex pseudouridine synthase subunit Cbf5 [Methanosarcinales archaeon]
MIRKKAGREKLVLKEAATDPEYGSLPSDRSISEHILRGVVNLEKPAGPTSHEVTAWVRKILGIGRAGHSGTLDPGVTGVLPIMLEDATRVVDMVKQAGKEYICLMRLHRPTPKAVTREICREFVGQIYQTPSLKSAVKRQLRTREIYAIDILELDQREALMRIECEAGTYVRKLCHDIGQVIGSGAHMQELRRVRAGPFPEDTSVTLHTLKDAYIAWVEEEDERELRRVIQPVENALAHLPRITLLDTAVAAICNGAPLATPGIAEIDVGIKKGDQILLSTLKGEAIAVATAHYPAEEIVKREKTIVATTKRVIMEPNTYPRHWKSQKIDAIIKSSKLC